MSVALTEPSKRIVENITKIVCELMLLKTEMISEANQGTEKQQKQIYILNSVLSTYAQKKKNILDKSFEFTPCVTKFYEKTISESPSENSSNSSTEENVDSDEQVREIPDNVTESEYEFSDVDEDDTRVVDEVMAKASLKLKKNRQTKLGIYITTIY
jgi:hypothetical protein